MQRKLTIKILSLNAYLPLPGYPKAEKRYFSLLAFLAKGGSDFVFLQEFHRSFAKRAYAITEIYKPLPIPLLPCLRPHFLHILCHHKWSQRQGSRQAIGKVRKLCYKAQGGEWLVRRSLLYFSLVVGTQKVYFLNTHLSPYKERSPIRLKQIDEILNHFGECSDPLLLIGDLNFRPDSEEYRYLMENRFMDSIVYHKQTGEQLLTWSKDNPYYDRSEDEGKLDYIFLRHAEELEVQEARIIKTYDLSDHFPIDLTFSLRVK